MQLRIDSIHHYSTSEIGDKWTTVSGGTGSSLGDTNLWTVAVGEGRNGGNAIKNEQLRTGNVRPGYLDVAPLMTEYGPWIPNAKGVCGFAIKVEDLKRIDTNVIENPNYFFAIYEGLGPIFFVKLAPNGTFGHYFYTEAAFDNGYVGASSQGIRSNTWAYVEFKWTVADAPDGQWVTRVNTIVVFDLTVNQATPSRRRVSGSSFSFDYGGIWNAVRLLQIRMTSITNTHMWLCDFYLADQEVNGGDYVVSDFCGDCSFGAIYPESVGTYAEWTPDGGGNNFDKVKEHPPDENTTTVSGATSGLRDRHGMQDVPAGAIIVSYQSLIRAKKTSVGSAVLDPVIRIGGVDYVADGQGVASADRFSYIIQPYDNDLSTPAQQLPEATANAMEAGYDKEV